LRGGAWGTSLEPGLAAMGSPVRYRPPAVAGLFYPGDPAVLRATVEAQLRAASRAARLARAARTSPATRAAGAARTAPPGVEPPALPPKALIAPHAGYAYSGPIAAGAFSTLADAEPDAAAPRLPAVVADRPAGSAGLPVHPGVSRVVLLGPAHRVAIRGLGLPAEEGFATPLGQVPLDLAAMAVLAAMPQVAVRPDAHEEEHSLEVELPFLQVVLGRFTLVPLVVGTAGADEVAEVLERVWGGPETLLVISSDLSHYLTAEAAERADRETAAEILALGGPLRPDQACGAAPINGLLRAARRRGMAARQLDLRHSGDTSGDRGRVVGYGAWAFDERAAA